MRNLRIGLMVVLCVLWAGAVWADDDKGGRDDRDHQGDKNDFAPVPETGQVLCYDFGTPINCAGSGQDGEIQAGIEIPTRRFTDKGDGTIKDKLTGLIGLKNAFCPSVVRAWQGALDDVKELNSTGKMNGNDCGDTSGRRGRHRTDWRLPNVRELFSLVDFAFFNPPSPNAAGTGQGSSNDPFTDFRSSGYWSSTTVAGNSNDAWVVSFSNGFVFSVLKAGPFAGVFHSVIALRGGS